MKNVPRFYQLASRMAMRPNVGVLLPELCSVCWPIYPGRLIHPMVDLCVEHVPVASNQLLVNQVSIQLVYYEYLKKEIDFIIISFTDQIENFFNFQIEKVKFEHRARN